MPTGLSQFPPHFAEFIDGCRCEQCQAVRVGSRPVRRWAVPLRRLGLTFSVGLLLLACLLVVALTLGCVTTSPPRPPVPPVDRTAEFETTCASLYLSTLQRAIDASGRVSCLAAARAGQTAAQIRATLEASEEFRALLARPPVPPVPLVAAVVRGRLRFDTKAHYPDGAEFQWRGVTAFGLAEQVAHGREAEASAWMTARRAQGFTIVRVLAMNFGWLNLPPADGRAALPRLFQLAKDADVYVLIVALAGTKDRPRSFLDDQVRAVGQACAAFDNCVLEIGNEPYHSSQHDALKLPSTLASLRAKVPAGVPVTYGAPRTDEPLGDTTPRIEGRKDDGTLYCGGDFVVLHRKRNADIWDDARRFTELSKVAKACGKFTVDDEPFGFAETPRVGTNTRRTEAYAAFGQGLLSHAFGLGSTFHCDACLLAIPLGPKQTAAADEFIAGSRFIRDGVTFRFVNGKATDSAVKDASFIGPNCSTCAVMRGFSFFSPGYNLLAWVGLRAGRDPKPVWQNGWTVKAVVAERPGLQVLELTK